MDRGHKVRSPAKERGNLNERLREPKLFSARHVQRTL